MPRARLADVATRAGVSTATASLVLRDRPGPSAGAREAVRLAAETLGYRPDRTASVLASHRSRLVGVLLDVSSTFHAELVDQLDAEATRHGYDLVLSTVTSARGERRAVETLVDFRCEGLALLGPTMPESQLRALARLCPVAAVGRPAGDGFDGVLAADRPGMAAAVDHLVGLGHEAIAYVDGPRGPIATARRRGYREAMRRHGLGAAVDVRAGGDHEASGMGAGQDLLGKPRTRRPSAVVTFNDRCAVGVLNAALRHGVDVPGDLSLVGYDDSPLARLATVDLTSVSQDPAALATATMDALAARLDGAAAGSRSAAGETVVVAPALIVRGSTACPA
ncbi:LacI family DNA-binding transcriptional regulator [Segeticoccus rhizosphaerae]|jgi:DNA-binding LacI/PurR family transcriptional regulator|uniref:LacI family DNA-binding transcriptional regulator n=1 Tax=Segeticoccus rhizosphaerae TaxID=1104777 RepID=UPI0010C12314|nr:LacI family DNA-binding transcriptional regulator [Ornithinicoccus soli]